MIKYLWSAAGYALISIPVMFSSTRSIGIQAPPLLGKGRDKRDDAVATRTESASPFHDLSLGSINHRNLHRLHL